MSIWNKVLIGLIIVASLAFFYMATRTLQTHKNWREKAQAHEHRIKEFQQQNRQLVRGVGEDEDYQPGIERLELELRKMAAGRGRVWRDSDPQPDPQTKQTGRVTVTTELHGIAEKTLVYVFDETDFDPVDPAKGGLYLGEFKAVVKVDEPNRGVDLEPSMKMSPKELQRLAISAAGDARWTMYEIMPADNHEIFAGLDEARLRELWPEGSPHELEYINDGKPAKWEDIQEWGPRGIIVDKQEKPLVDEQGEPIEGVQGTYRRWLRDYQVLLKSQRMQRSILSDLIDAAKVDRDYVTSALTEAQEQEKYRQREKVLLTTETDKYEYECSAVSDLLQKLRGEVKAYQEAVNRLIVENMADAAQIDKIQQDAKRRIDARTGTMAQSAVGETR